MTLAVRPWSFEGTFLLEPQPFVDDRGFFVRTLSASALADAGLVYASFVEESQSRSRKGVLRGLHGRCELRERKLVRCAHGRIFEVVVDLRPWSSTFLEWDSLVLDDCTHRQLCVAPGLVHGFQVLTDTADVCYRMDAVYDPSLDVTVAWDDPDLGVPWPIPDPVLSGRDRAAPRVADLRPLLETWFGRDPPS